MSAIERLRKHLIRNTGLAFVIATSSVLGGVPVAEEQFEQAAQKTYAPSGQFEGFYEIVLDEQVRFLMEPTLASEKIELAQIESFEGFGSLTGKKIIRYTDGNLIPSLPNSQGRTSGAYLMFEAEALGKTRMVFFPTFTDPHIRLSSDLKITAYKGDSRGEITVE